MGILIIKQFSPTPMTTKLQQLSLKSESLETRFITIQQFYDEKSRSQSGIIQKNLDPQRKTNKSGEVYLIW